MIPLPTRASRPARLTRRRSVRQLDHPRLLGAALVDAEQPTAAHLDEGVLVEDLDLQPAFGADRHGHLGEAGRGEMAVRGVGRDRGPVAWPRPALCRARRRRVSASLVGGVGDDRQLSSASVPSRLAPQRIVAVAGQQHPLDDGLGGACSGATESTPSRLNARAACVATTRPGERRGCVAQPGDVERPGRHRCRPPRRRSSDRRRPAPPASSPTAPSKPAALSCLRSTPRRRGRRRRPGRRRDTPMAPCALAAQPVRSRSHRFDARATDGVGSNVALLSSLITDSSSRFVMGDRDGHVRSSRTPGQARRQPRSTRRAGAGRAWRSRRSDSHPGPSPSGWPGWPPVSAGRPTRSR